MDLRSTFEHYYPENSIGPGSGDLQGQCAVFAQTLVQMPLVGDTIDTKKTVCRSKGILRKDVKEFLAGDVLVLDIGTKAGHIAVVSSTDQKRLNLSESNWNDDLRVHHTRWILATSPQIYGIFRGKLKVPIMSYKFPLTIVTTQDPAWVQKQTEEAVLEVLKASEARLEPVVDIQQKSFPSIPFSEDRIDDTWYRNTILPLCAHLPMFHCSVAEWKATNQGYETSGGIHFRADENEQLHFSQSGVTVKAFVQNFVHELCHRLFRLTGQAEITHQFMFPPYGVWNPKGAYSQIDYSKLKKGDTLQLVNDKGTVYILAGNKDKRKIGIADAETLGLFGDEPQIQMDTSNIPQYQTMRKGFVIDNK